VTFWAKPLKQNKTAAMEIISKQLKAGGDKSYLLEAL
jgi:hypothetical protein